MPLALLVIATLIFVIAIRGNYSDAGQLFNETFWGNSSKQGFGIWFGSIFVLAILFRMIQAPKAGELFIFLVMIVYFISHNDVLTKIDQSIQNTGKGQ